MKKRPGMAHFLFKKQSGMYKGKVCFALLLQNLKKNAPLDHLNCFEF